VTTKGVYCTANLKITLQPKNNSETWWFISTSDSARISLIGIVIDFFGQIHRKQRCDQNAVAMLVVPLPFNLVLQLISVVQIFLFLSFKMVHFYNVAKVPQV